ncbi:MAG: indole-3-glycerol phosphate synthase TrpC [Bdellovibrionota bacterium]
MNNILDEIIAHKKIEVEQRKKQKSYANIRALAEEHLEAKDFGCALLPMSDAPIRIIAECKKMSPSKGLMCVNYNPASIAKAYEKGGAAAISVLTDEKYFGGSLEDLKKVRDITTLPILRKDFIIDEYQIFEARAAGADSFLLLSGVLDYAQLQYFIEIGRDLGMEPLIESHNKEQLEAALKTDGKILGINNRNLSTFSVDLQHSKELYNQAKGNLNQRVLVCESGIKNSSDITKMKKVGFKAFLVGEALITNDNHEEAVRQLTFS